MNRSAAQKRKRSAAQVPEDEEPESSVKTGRAKKVAKKEAKKEAGPEKEKRLKRFRNRAPKDFAVLLERATQQRFYVLSRVRHGVTMSPEETVEITGSTGNLYTVTIAELPSCTCPYAREGKQCKHVVFVTSRVLRARSDLVYQLAFVPSELREIFANAPPIHFDGAAEDLDPNRKALDGDCPICFMSFEKAGGESVVYCRATCGQNIHRDCFNMWANTKRQSSGKVTCPMCRSPWQAGDESIAVNEDIKDTAVVGREGYLNVGSQLGLSQVRDESSYYHPSNPFLGNFGRSSRPAYRLPSYRRSGKRRSAKQ